MCENKFYVCEHCGNMVGMIHDAGVPMMCCGQKMTKLEPGVVEASHEKHIPVVTREGDTVKVVNTGLNYSSYVQWVGEHISDPYMAARFCFGIPSTDKNYKVIKIAEHERNHSPLAYIEEIDGLGYNECYLIEVKGLEKV